MLCAAYTCIDGRKPLKSAHVSQDVFEEEISINREQKQHKPAEEPTVTQDIVGHPHSPAEEPTTSSFSSSNVYDSAGAPAGTTTYIRWGRTVCPDSSKLVYYGYAAGTFFTHAGGGVGPICLPAPSSKKLEYLEYQPGFQRTGLLYGAEYETGSIQTLSDLQDTNVPCALCQVDGRTSTLMIPGLLTCPSDWTKEYQGYLMSSHIVDAANNQYSCVDDEMTFFRGTKPNNDGMKFFTIEIENHPSLCPPFLECDGRELSCVVCTK